MIPYYYCMYVVISIVVKITGLSILTCTRVTRAIATRRQQVGMAIERFVCGVHVEACILRKPAGRLGVVSPCERSEN